MPTNGNAAKLVKNLINLTGEEKHFFYILLEYFGSGFIVDVSRKCMTGGWAHRPRCQQSAPLE